VKLTREHHKALVLCLRLERDLPGAADGEVQAIFDDVLAFREAALTRHFRAENECLVTRLVRHVPLDDEMVARLCRDHIRLDGLIVSMKDQRTVPALRKGLREFAEVLRDHIHWEEDVLFERTQELMEEAELDALGSDLDSVLPEELDFPIDRLYPKTPRSG
jgi:hemerythrin-like domain-containing protein